jgi:NADH-quinone oxidoreductase subunit L
LPASLFWTSLAAGLVCAVAGVALAWARYGAGQVPAGDVAPGALITFLRRRWYVDAVYDAVIVRPVVALSRLLRIGVEDDILDSGARGVGDAFDGLSASLRGFQTGYLRNYALTLFLGAIIILVYFIAVSQ